LTAGVFCSRSGYPNGYFDEVNMPLSQFDERSAFTTTNAAVAGAGPAILTLVTGSLYGTRLDQIIFAWNGVAPLEVDVDINDGFGDIAFLGTVTIPPQVGTAQSVIDVIDALMPSTQPFVTLPSGFQIRATLKVLLAGAETFTQWLSGGTF
jgi:hypothetical protein